MAESAQFRIDGSTVLTRDPTVRLIGPRPVYGWQGNGRRVEGPYETYELSWAYLTDSEFSALKSRIDSTQGNRRTITIAKKSSVSWEVQSGDIQLTGYARDERGFAVGVSIVLNRVST